MSLVVPAGAQSLTVKIGEGTATEEYRLAAAEVMEFDIVVGVGRAVLNALYVEGLPVEDGGMGVKVFGAKKSMSGDRQEFGYGYGPDNAFDLPPGDYIAVLRLDEAEVEVPFSVEAGQVTEVEGTLEAGVVALTMPNAESFRLEGAKKDITGKRREFGYGYDESVQRTLPAGDYVAIVTKKGAEAPTETPFTVVAGERLELTIE